MCTQPPTGRCSRMKTAAVMQHNSVNFLFGSCKSGCAARVLVQNNSSTSQNLAFNAPVIPKVEELTVLLNFASCCSLPTGWWSLQPPPQEETLASDTAILCCHLASSLEKPLAAFIYRSSQKGIQQWIYSCDRINLAWVKSSLPPQKWDLIMQVFSNLKDSVIP